MICVFKIPGSGFSALKGGASGTELVDQFVPLILFDYSILSEISKTSGAAIYSILSFPKEISFAGLK